MIVIISGPIGAGKTTVARELLDRLGNAVAYLEGDAFWPFIIRESPSQSPHKRFIMTMRAMLAAARHYHRDDYNVVVDFSIPLDFLDAVKRLLLGEPFHFAILLPTEARCAQRASERESGKIENYAIYHDFYLQFVGDDERSIRNDDASPDAIARDLYDGIESGRFLVMPERGRAR